MERMGVKSRNFLRGFLCAIFCWLFAAPLLRNTPTSRQSTIWAAPKHSPRAAPNSPNS